MSTETALETTIEDVVELSPELTEGETLIDGQIRLYDVVGGDTLESNAERFFDRTLLTDGLAASFRRLRDTLNGEDNVRIQEMYGPYGTGKSHQMVALYHCFASPEIVADWADGRIEGLCEALPSDAEPIVLSLQKQQFDYLWEPLFDALDYTPDRADYDNDGGYPTIDVIGDAVGDRTVAFFVDELEDFFESLSGSREAANRGFLQAMCEASTRPETELFPVVSVLREESTVQDILSRQERVEVNMSNQVSIGEVLRHRLIGEVRDEDRLRSLVESYVDSYVETDYVDLPAGFREDLLETYPFHPALISALETRYAAGSESGSRRTTDGDQIQSGPTRGMLYLFARVLVDRHDETDLLTHGEVDAVDYNDELGRINIQHDRPDRCYDDIVQRLADAGIDYGREILSTVLIHSLTPGLDEGATEEDIVVGTFHAGARDRMNDIVVDLRRLQGEVYHLWADDDERYVIREDENPRSLVRNAARDVSDERALNLIAQTVESVFGAGTHPVGFNPDGRLEAVPDDRRVKTVVKNGPWTESEVAEVVKNQPTGRQWRNTLVFVQPSGGTEIGADSRREFVEKASEVVGARLRKDDQNFAEEIREAIADLETEYEDDLQSRVQSAYGDVLDTDDPLNGFETATTLDLETYTGLDRLPTANEIVAATEAGPFDLQRHAGDIVDDRLGIHDQITVKDVYERFLRELSRPIPADETAVADAVGEALDGSDVLVHETGFTESFDDLDPETTLVSRDNVADWDETNVVEALRTAFGRGETEIDLGEFELDLRRRTDVWFPEQTVEAAVKRAAGRLARDNQYVLVAGSEILEKSQPDATLRDVSDAERVGAETVRDQITSTVTEHREVDTNDVLGSIRNDLDVYLPADETRAAFRQAVEGLLRNDYRLREGETYPAELGSRDPRAVTVVPFLGEEGQNSVLQHVAEFDAEATFTAEDVRGAVVSEKRSIAVANVLLSAMAGDRETEYLIASSSSAEPDDWFPGARFRVPKGIEEFEYDGTDTAEMRQKWSAERPTGEVVIGVIEYTTPGDGAVPSPLAGVVEFDRSQTTLDLPVGITESEVTELLERVPGDATDIEVEIDFE